MANAMILAKLVLNVLRTCPVSTSHTLRVASKDPEAINLLSVIGSEWPSSVSYTEPDSRYHNTMTELRFAETEATSMLLGAKPRGTDCSKSVMVLRCSPLSASHSLHVLSHDGDRRSLSSSEKYT